MDVIHILPALVEHRLTGAPKKARKVMISDPFIFHAIRNWLEPDSEPYENQAVRIMRDPEWAGRMAELCASAHFARRYPTYYIKAEGEIDIAYISSGDFHPIEVKWTGQIRSKDLKQLRKYRNATILSRQLSNTVHGIPNEPLPVGLFRLGPSPFIAVGD